jgi:hypothetical protein
VEVVTTNLRFVVVSKFSGAVCAMDIPQVIHVIPLAVVLSAFVCKKLFNAICFVAKVAPKTQPTP